MKKKKVFSFKARLDIVTGLPKVMVDIHQAIKEEYESVIVSTIPYEKVNPTFGIQRHEYRRFLNPFMFYRSTVFLHERKDLLIFWCLNHFLFQRINIVYVHHNIFNTLKRWTLMPKTVVSISDRCTENLIEYFKVPKSRIHKIHNCAPDRCPPEHATPTGDTITLLYPARINHVKRQVEIVERLKGRLNNNVRILFAGTGRLFEELKAAIGDSKQFVAMGYVDNIPELMLKCDYMLLFSKHEGLPITLIEADMSRLPIVCNDVGGNTEIAYDGENAFVVNDWEALIKTLNGLHDVPSDQYKAMSERGRQIYEEKFTFRRFQHDYLQLLHSVTGSF